MSNEPLPDQQALKDAFDHDIYSSSGNPLKFGSLFYDCDAYPAEKRILLIFIRHFFCGNCQEYVRRLSSTDSPFHPSHKSISTTWTTNFSKPASRSLPTIIIIGPGQPSLISSYKSRTQCPFDIYADPSSRLYDILGMHRTLSMGVKAPEYIEHSLFSGAVKSAWQIVRRVGNGDAMGGGDWDVNGGEYLFVRSATRSRSSSRSPSRSRTRSRSASSQGSTTLEWQTSWCHRMFNSRDHTELLDLAYRTCFSVHASPTALTDLRTDFSAPPLRSILVNNSRSSSKPVARSYSSERLGSCPAPKIPKSLDETLESQHQSYPKSQMKSKSPHRSRSRSTSVGSQSTAKQNHERVWSRVGSTDAMRSESSAPTTETRGSVVVSPISEGEEEGPKPRKSFTASIAERLGVRSALLGRSKSISGRSTAADEAPPNPRPSTSLSDLRTFSRANNNTTKQRSKSNTPSIALLRTNSRTKHQPAGNGPPQDTSPSRPASPSKSHTRTRTFSFSKPSLGLTKKPSGTVEMDENGAMFVDGVEFVNVISIKARVDADGSHNNRRERADSGLGMEDEVQHRNVAERQRRPAYSMVTALPEINAQA